MGHQSIEASGDRRPLGVLLSYAFFCIDLQIDLLVLSQFGDENILMNQLDIL